METKRDRLAEDQITDLHGSVEEFKGRAMWEVLFSRITLARTLELRPNEYAKGEVSFK